MYISSAPWNPLAPSSARISGPSPHTTKYSKIRDDDPISAAGTGDHRPAGRDPRRGCGRLPLSMVSSLSMCTCERKGGGGQVTARRKNEARRWLRCGRKATRPRGSPGRMVVFSFDPLRIWRQMVFPLFVGVDRYMTKIYYFADFVQTAKHFSQSHLALSDLSTKILLLHSKLLLILIFLNSEISFISTFFVSQTIFIPTF